MNHFEPEKTFVSWRGFQIEFKSHVEEALHGSSSMQIIVSSCSSQDFQDSSSTHGLKEMQIIQIKLLEQPLAALL